jgi:hypothetical protein
MSDPIDLCVYQPREFAKPSLERLTEIVRDELYALSVLINDACLRPVQVEQLPTVLQIINNNLTVHNVTNITNEGGTGVADLDCCGIIVRECTDVFLPEPEDRISPEYVYETYVDDGTFTPPAWVEWVDVIVVGAGGTSVANVVGGGKGRSGGAGAGAVRILNNVPVTGPVAITHGKAATSGAGPGVEEPPGGSSAFGSIVALGGGCGQKMDTSATGTPAEQVDILLPRTSGGEGGCGGGGAGLGTLMTFDGLISVQGDPSIRVGGAGNVGGFPGGSITSPLIEWGGNASAGGGGARERGGDSSVPEVGGKGGDGWTTTDAGWPYIGTPPATPDEYNAGTTYAKGAWVRAGQDPITTGNFVFQAQRTTVGEPPNTGVSGANFPVSGNTAWRLYIPNFGGGGGGAAGPGSVYPAAVGQGGVGGGGNGAAGSFAGGRGRRYSGGGAGGSVTSNAYGGDGVVMVRYLTEASAALQPPLPPRDFPIWRCIELTAAGGVESRIVIEGGDAQSGDPVFDLREITQTETGALRAVTIDAWGRVSGNRAPTTEDITPILPVPVITPSMIAAINAPAQGDVLTYWNADLFRWAPASEFGDGGGSGSGGLGLNMSPSGELNMYPFPEA